MYIYKEREDRIDIYLFEPNKLKVKEYKEKVLGQQPISFADLQTNYYETISQLEKRVTSLDSIDYTNKKKFSDLYFNLAESSKKKREEERTHIFEEYMRGKFDSRRPIIITSQSRDGKIEPLYFFLVVTDVEMFHTCKREWYRIDNIIMLPRELYLLGLFFSGNAKELTEEEFQVLMGLGISALVGSIEMPKETKCSGYVSRDSFRVKEKTIRRSLKKYGEL